MYQPNDLVIFGIHGVCRVLPSQAMEVDGKTAYFLALEPLMHGGGKILIPEDNPAALGKLSPLLSERELEALTDLPTVRDGRWEPNENLRKQRHKELISGVDREGLLREICTLYRKKKSLAESGKRMRQSDGNFLSDAQKRICGEIAAVKNLPPEVAMRYLKEKLQ